MKTLQTHLLPALLAIALPLAVANAAEPTRLYIANDDHTDYMWTADAETYEGVFVDMIDYYLALADATEANPAPYQSRFNPDGSFWLWTYERRLPKPVLQKRPHEIYWYTGLDGQRVLMKWYSLAHRIGTYLEAGWTINTLRPTERGGPYEAVDFLDHDADFLQRYHAPGSTEPYRVRGAFGFGGDSLAEKTGVPGDPGVPKEPGLNSNIPGWPETEHFTAAK